MPPNSASVRSAMALADAGSETSTGMASAVPPSATICLATRSPASALMSATTAAAPSRASASAYAWPMPPAEPVTIGTLLSNCPMLFLPCRMWTYCTLFAEMGVTTPRSALYRFGDDLGLQVLFEARYTHLAAHARLFVAAERHVARVPDAAVDVDRPGP